MKSKSNQLALQLGVAAFLLHLLEPKWFEYSLIGLTLVVSTLLLTTTSLLALFIKTIKPSLYPISNASVVVNTLGTGLLVIVSIKLQDVFPVYAGIGLGMILFVFALVFQRKKVTA